jgi:hypothetical protein
MTPDILLYHLTELGVTVRLSVDARGLDIEAPDGALSPELIELLREHKSGMVDLVYSHEEAAAIEWEGCFYPAAQPAHSTTIESGLIFEDENAAFKFYDKLINDRAAELAFKPGLSDRDAQLQAWSEVGIFPVWYQKRRQAYRLIESVEVKESVALSPIGDKIQNESQARALSVVPQSERSEVLEEAAKTGAVTAKSITEAAEKATGTKPEKPAEQLDKTGYAIPQSILEDWNRADETSRLMLSQISKLKIQLKTGLDTDIIFAEVTNTSVADFTNAYTSIKCVVPYAVCTSCQGHHRKKCSLCRTRGFLSEFAWRSFVPSEVKALRGAK